MRRIIPFILLVFLSLNNFTSFAAEKVFTDVFKTGNIESEMKITRGEFSRLLTTALYQKGFYAPYEKQENSYFFDVSVSRTDYIEISQLHRMGIVSGKGNYEFRPDDFISMGEACTMLVRCLIFDESLISDKGGYPVGYVSIACEKGIVNMALQSFDSVLEQKTALVWIENLKNELKGYSIMQKINGVTYNGKIHVDYYPKYWQGLSVMPAALKGYAKLLPFKVTYSFDNENWFPAYEEMDGKNKYYALPENNIIDRYEYLWGSENCFIGYKNNRPICYSYDLLTWSEGSPVINPYKALPLSASTYPFGIKSKDIVSDYEFGLYFAWHPYKIVDRFEKAYQMTFSDFYYNKIWVSKDLKNWKALELPDGKSFFGATLNPMGNCLVIEGIGELTAEEKAEIENQEKTALSLGKSFVKYDFKTDFYIVDFNTILNLFRE